VRSMRNAQLEECNATGLYVYSFETSDLELLIADFANPDLRIHHHHKKTSRLISNVLTGYLVAH
jgi:hypothetical protein